MQVIAETQPDVILLDFEFQSDPFNLVDKIASEYPAARWLPSCLNPGWLIQIGWFSQVRALSSSIPINRTTW